MLDTFPALTCRLLPPFQVSWMRQRDLRIMTVGLYTYTTDQRFEVIHSPESKDWILKIKYAQVRDSGNYECQVSTKPVMSYVVRLSVFGECPKCVGVGLTFNTCIIERFEMILRTFFKVTEELRWAVMSVVLVTAWRPWKNYYQAQEPTLVNLENFHVSLLKHGRGERQEERKEEAPSMSLGKRNPPSWKL